MLRHTLFNHLPAFNLARWLPRRKPATRASAVHQRFIFTPTGQLMCSTDEGRSWAEVVSVAPGYRHLKLWQSGAETHLRLDYADHSVEWLSTDGSEWRTA